MKYKLTDVSIEFFGRKLFQIECVVGFSSVSVGEKGGYIEAEKNLDHTGNAWVSGDARVYGNAMVSGDARVYGNARVSGNAMVSGEAWVSGKARVSGDARVLSGYIKLSLENKSYSLMAQCGIAFVSGKAILYKKVNKMSKGKYRSLQDTNFIYQDGKVSKVENPDMSDASCSTGIHLSTALYWEDGDTLIACEVKEKDLITVQQGKARVKACKVIGEVKI